MWKSVTLDDVIIALKELGGEAQSWQIKDKVTAIFGGVPTNYKNKTSFRETIQVIIQEHCPQENKYKKEPIFQRIRRGRFRLINKSTLIIPKQIQNNVKIKSEITKNEVGEIDPNGLLELIKSYNKEFEEVIPKKKIAVSEQVARPGLITDYIKKLENYTCQICNQKGFIQNNNAYYIEAHHIIELHKLISGSLCSDNIIIVCPTCHKKLHYARIEYKMIAFEAVEVKINDAVYSFKRNVIAK